MSPVSISSKRSVKPYKQDSKHIRGDQQIGNNKHILVAIYVTQGIYYRDYYIRRNRPLDNLM